MNEKPPFPLRLGFDAKRAFQNAAGLGNYSRFVLKALREHAPQLDLFAYTPRRKTELFPTFPTDRIKTPEGFPYQQLPALWRSYGLVRDLRRDGVQLYHGLSNELPTGLAAAGVRSVVTIHDVIFERFPHLYPWLDRQFYRAKTKAACAQADVIVAVSQQTKNDLIEFYGIDAERIQVVYQDCQPAFQSRISKENIEAVLAKYGLDKSELYILSVGTIEERKNQIRLVEAFAKLPSKDSKLVIVGRPTAYAQKLRQRITELQLGNEVHLLHDVPSQDLPALYQGARVFAYVSIFEGFGIPIVEALHSGVPVLAATGSCLEEAGGPGALYASPTDIEQMAGVLSQLLEDVPLRSQLISAGTQHVQQFSAKNIAKQLTEIYTEILP
ncbi:glycosyltransferase family 4 protein [Persicitalea sp.]|uniref:glycosyltransferase family 4 protein n=1 Tax=Persicitalea sp. TaxID=3100273 RepID=UPI003593014E